MLTKNYVYFKNKLLIELLKKINFSIYILYFIFNIFLKLMSKIQLFK